MKITLEDPPYGPETHEISELTLAQCIAAFNARLTENNAYPNSGFRRFIDPEMIMLKDRIKLLRRQKKKCPGRAL